MSNREQWFIKNAYKRRLALGDLPKVPYINPGQVVDILLYHNKLEIEQSVALKVLLRKNWLKLTKVDNGVSRIPPDSPNPVEPEESVKIIEEDELAGGAGGPTTGSDVSLDTSGFNGILSPVEDDVQKALDQIDDLDASEIPYDNASSGLAGNSVQDAIDELSVSGVVDKHDTYNQVVPSATWNINHNLGKFPSVTIVDTGGTEIEGEVTHIDENNVTITFSAAFSGKAYFN